MWSEGTISPGDLALLGLCAPGSEESFIRGMRGLINYTGKELEGREGDRQGGGHSGLPGGINTL